jgi:hypothetical protein
MAFYADKAVVKLSDKTEQYGKILKPGSTPPAPGIYKCQNCGFEDVINRECSKLPPCSSCEHVGATWKMLVKAVDK